MDNPNLCCAKAKAIRDTGEDFGAVRNAIAGFAWQKEQTIALSSVTTAGAQAERDESKN